MRKKWIPLLVIALLIISPFSTAGEVYAMSNNQSKESQQSDEHIEEEDNNRIDAEQDALANEAESEEVRFQLGDEEEAIQELKEDLTELGFAALEDPTEYFGLHTEESVKVFQAFHDIEETGIADEETLQMIEDLLSEDSFDREAHLEFSKPEEFETESEEVEQNAEVEEDAESEEGSESEGEQGSETEEGAESEEEQGSETEEGAESEEEQGSETEEGAESEEEQGSETEEDAESEEEQGSETEEGAESEEEQGSETEEGAESEEEQGSETEEDAESEEEQGSETEEDAESEEEQGSETEEGTESKEEQGSETEEDAESEEEQGSETEENAETGEEDQEIGEQRLNEVETFAAQSTYQQGDRHSEIVKFKKKLNAIGFGYITETTLFGSFMETQVTRFQEYYGLPANGKMDRATKEKLDSFYNSPFQQGKRHDDIPDIKQKLNNLGYGYISVTTLFGTFMEQKVEQFQRDHGLRVSGIADEVTLAKLNELAPQDTYQRGDRHEDMIQFKQQLNAVGFGYITETTLFGSFMETQVKRFQEYYGLSVNGQIDEATKEKLDSVYNSPFQQGKRHDDIPDMKRDLNNLGYGYISITTLFGSFMEQKVEEFQSDQGLRVNGIIDEVTLDKMNELAPQDTYQRGDRHADIVTYKEQLNGTGFGYITETTLFGSFMETQVKRFQEYYGLSVNGQIDEATKEKLDSVYNSPFQQGKRHDDIPDIKRDLNNLGYGYISITTLFGSFMEQKVEEFQRDHGLRVNGIIDEVTLAKLNEAAPEDTYQRGDRHADIVTYKEQLNAVGFGYITETTLFGSFMETQVKRFQEYYGLNVNGTIDNATKIKLNSVYNSPFQQGKRHNDIPDIKQKLNSLGYGYISITTLFGSYMEQKVEQFQRDNGLRVNGMIDEVTLSQINQAFDQQSNVKIFLDPGHGAHDPGGQGYGLNEKDVVLDIALETERILTSKYQGVEVEMSRRSDVFVELTERANHANRWGADYFVSFHNNAFNGSTGGFESYIYNGDVSQETRNRQNDIHSYISSRLNVSDRGQKSANFNVLRNTDMPAILIEYLFIDNFTENALLRSESYKKQLAQYTADAIAQSYNLERR
ncbi:peptidoglycan-binding protein [Oceanobacillus oncorhynchi]|uniref:peptidoglycan-binding protein n=1 Tax=Oceanobacillus oncorhynchi TaxID=545501 RepID=UPI00211625CF|nr:peptidoglycan-binding protein [Oceanobacillus oncorhynchi]UUI39543.1 peptidoglycan-binding protein [Oceanobacillus oncorhynchi]